MEMNVFHVALKCAFGEQEWPDLNAILHRSMVAARRQDGSYLFTLCIVRSSGSARKEPRPMLIANSSALRSSSVSLSLHIL
jgi:hypothetical protein